MIASYLAGIQTSQGCMSACPPVHNRRYLSGYLSHVTKIVQKRKVHQTLPTHSQFNLSYQLQAPRPFQIFRFSPSYPHKVSPVCGRPAVLPIMHKTLSSKSTMSIRTRHGRMLEGGKVFLGCALHLDPPIAWESTAFCVLLLNSGISSKTPQIYRQIRTKIVQRRCNNARILSYDPIMIV